MKIYVNIRSGSPGNGSKESPFLHIQEAAAAAQPGDEVIVAPGIYREYVHPVHAGREDARITYTSSEPLGAVITGAELLTGWVPYKGDVWTASVDSSVFAGYNPYTTYVYGDWYFAGRTRHTGAVYRNDRMLYEALSLEECIAGEICRCSWEPEESRCKWYSEQKGGKTIFYVNISGADPNQEKMEINVREQCFVPKETGIGYITVRGFTVTKAATCWAPPAAHQDCMIGPHWSKGWIIEDCEISNSKCSGIGLGKYLDPENDHYFTNKHVKSPTQMERDAVCRGQYHGWTKETIGSHIIRRNNIHHCQQGGIIGRMGAVFSVIEDNHIHHINNMMELGGAEIAGIKLHAAIDVIIRRNHIHHCTMGIWTDWEAQGTRISQNLLHDNQKPDFAEPLQGGMMSQDLFVEVSHGPTLIDNNLLLSDVSLRFAAQGVALVHNLICGSFTAVGEGCDSMVEGKLRQRYTPYHIPHRTEVMGFMTILHGDDRFFNNIFVQHWPDKAVLLRSDSEETWFTDNREVGTHVFDDYEIFDDWIKRFVMDQAEPDMKKLEPAHFRPLPVWAEGNVYLAGAKKYKKERHALIVSDRPVFIELSEENGHMILRTDLYDAIRDFDVRLISSNLLGKAFEPEERFENPDGSDIIFREDYLGRYRDMNILPGPFAEAAAEQIVY
ncbi:MAG: right-handed parallel beta-helix repeat-containing protein [Eubacterium sp.]|nr:right-handed parallel beta-helix repeat-containing protein [Eubacterium sp.]